MKCSLRASMWMWLKLARLFREACKDEKRAKGSRNDPRMNNDK
jgi:hypothetical protein